MSSRAYCGDGALGEGAAAAVSRKKETVWSFVCILL